MQLQPGQLPGFNIRHPLGWTENLRQTSPAEQTALLYINKQVNPEA